MVDTISSAKGIRQVGSSRYGASPASSPSDKRAVAPISETTGAGRHDHDGSEQDAPDDTVLDDRDLRLEVDTDDAGNHLVYRFVDAHTGTVIRQWDANELAKLRDYMCEKKIHILDRKV